jgi:uncharacterized protein (DUF1330 family)
MVYYMISYDIDNWEGFSQYGPALGPLFQKYGAVVLASDTSAIVVEGEGRMMNAIVQFPSEEAALGMYYDPEYIFIKKLRVENTSRCTMVLVRQA